MERAVFLDRDGTIIKDVGYLDDGSNIRVLPRVIEAIKLLNQNGFKVIVVTNQSGIARGYFTEEDVREINYKLKELLACEGAILDGIYYCPHHVNGIVEEYRTTCYCRKPNPGMLEAAAGEFNLDLKSSFVIGDNLADIEAGHNARCTAILLRDKYSWHGKNGTKIKPDYIARDLYGAVKQVVLGNLASKDDKGRE
ncbi:MAG: HAD family hydrolase [Dehalococcoidales bacterium]|nr:HAD family hydrolase [Dehalococcoidales bacterium]